jgi:hypothetical protein
MTNRFPPFDWYLRPDQWPNWMTSSPSSSGLMLTPSLGPPWGPDVPAPSHPAPPVGSDSGILGNFGQAPDDPWATMRHPGTGDLPTLPIPFALPAAFSFPMPAALRASGSSTVRASPAYNTAPSEDMRRVTAASFSRTAEQPAHPPQPNDWDTFLPPIEHLDSTRYWGAASMPSRESSEQPPSIDHYLSPVPRAPDWDAIAPGENAGGGPSWNASAGDLDAGQWASDGRNEAGTVPRTLSDATPDNYWIPGADYAAEHHEFPRAHYRRMPPETRKVFDRATVGQLFLNIDGRRHEFDAFHRAYNTATGELLERFMRQHNVPEPEQMTPDHARAVEKAIAQSNDPRIQYYREFVRRLRMFYRLRIGVRGAE